MKPTIDTAYEILQAFGPEYGPMGFSNHGPMAVEALVALGREEAAVPWAERYAQMLGPFPASREAVTEANWTTALSQENRYADWVDFFDRQLESQEWTAVLDTWAYRLAPGMIGAALHGILRAAHAVRPLAETQNTVRRRELAQGLAYWATTFHKLPGDPAGATRGLDPSEALRAVSFLPTEQRRLMGSIVDALRPLEGFVPFRTAIDLVDTSAVSPGETLSDITEALAAGYLANATRANLIALIHFVTGPSSIRLLLPHVSESTGRRLLAYAWQAGAALYCVYGTTPAGPALSGDAPSRDEVIDAALATGDEHAIKFTEACLREEAARPSPVFRAAARDATKRLAAGW